METQKRKKWVLFIEDLLSRLKNELVEKGYASNTIHSYMKDCHTFQEWCKSRKETLLELPVKDAIDIYLSNNFPENTSKQKSSRYNMSHAALYHLSHLINSIPEYYSNKQNNKKYPVEAELSRFSQYLKQTCGLSESTLFYRKRIVKEFLCKIFGQGSVKYNKLQPEKVLKYISKVSKGYKPGTVSVITTSIRSYLKYLQFCGKINPQLVSLIPAAPHWRMASYPVVLSEPQIKTLVQVFDITEPSGMRDQAILLSMLYMGLRASEIAYLSLEDIDWRQSILHVYQSKSRTFKDLPLLTNCGSAIARYLRYGRPHSETRKVFVRHTVPVGSMMNPENVRGAIRRGYAIAGFPKSWTGTHILRHTAATRMLNSGATLKQISDVLGHKSIDTAMIYTKVNLTELRTVSQPWPGWGDKNE